MDSILFYVSNNKLFLGSIMLLTNIGGKYLMLDIPKNLENLFMEYFILRCLVLFSIFFMATRDIKISILLTLVLLIVLKYVINEKSSYCVIKEKNVEKKVTPEEYKSAQNIIYKYTKENKPPGLEWSPSVNSAFYI
jgi:hypothetical protein